MKKNMLTLIIILGLSLLSSKDESVFLKQVELENIYKFKIESFLEKIYDKSEYYVFADVRLEQKPTPKSEKEDNSTLSSDNDTNDSDPFGYTFIEGLGLNPTLPTAPINSNEKKEEKKIKKEEQEYIMTGLNVSIYLAEDIYNVEARETITNFVNTNIDEIRNCFDCFVLEKMPNHYDKNKDVQMMSNQAHHDELQALKEENAAQLNELKGDIDTILTNYNQVNSEYAAFKDSLKWDRLTSQHTALRDELQSMLKQAEAERATLVDQHHEELAELMQENQRQFELSREDQVELAEKMEEVMAQKETELKLILEAKDKELDFLIQQLDDATSARLFWEDQEARRNTLQNNLDSLKFINLMSIQDEYRSKQNRLLEDITSDYENSIQARINDAKGTEERLFRLIEGQQKTASSKDEKVEIEAYKKSSNRMILYIIIAVAVFALMALVAILLMKKNKKVVYLKPRGASQNNTAPVAEPKEFSAPPTASNDNTDVVRSEVRSLRQSAVTMSAGQKEGASQIISDWLDESSDGNDEANDDNSEKEE
mgnify:CR=1 FL=1